MSEPTKKEMTRRAQRLRREMTKEERHLWYGFLKPSGIQVHRQKQFGPYIVDFYIASAKLVIELDGSQHFEQTGQSYDKNRDEYLQNLGLTVVRYANSDVNQNFRGVCEDILHRLHQL